MPVAKEAQHFLRWGKALAKARQSGAKAAADAPRRYTNFSLAPIWEKFDCQTQLLCREAFVPLMRWNPALLEHKMKK